MNSFHTIELGLFDFITPLLPFSDFPNKTEQRAAVRPRCVTPLCCTVGRQTDRQRLGGGREGKMSGIMLLSVSLTLCLLWATGGTARSGAVILRDALERGPVSLNDMFREVEELMEDTQHILEEAVDQVCVIFY